MMLINNKTIIQLVMDFSTVYLNPASVGSFVGVNRLREQTGSVGIGLVLKADLTDMKSVRPKSAVIR